MAVAARLRIAPLHGPISGVQRALLPRGGTPSQTSAPRPRQTVGEVRPHPARPDSGRRPLMHDVAAKRAEIGRCMLHNVPRMVLVAPSGGPTGAMRFPLMCVRVARYEGMRSRPILTEVGWARIDRPHYLGPVFHTEQFPAGVELDIVKRTDRQPVRASTTNGRSSGTS
jgi:hypothetical protein